MSRGMGVASLERMGDRPVAGEESDESAKAAPVEKGPVVSKLKWAWEHWATRSLAVGGIATAIDICFGTSLLLVGMPTRWAAMSGVVLGGTFTFLANRYFAFRERNPKLAKPALRFVVVTGLASIVHGQVVVWLRDVLGVPFVVSKMAADLVVFTFGQLLLFRYIVFPKQKEEAEPAPEGGSEVSSEPATDTSQSG